MKLKAFFQTVAPYLDGSVSHPVAARRLFGSERLNGPDARRWAIYGDFCRTHRFEALSSVYEATRGQILALQGAPCWEQLVEDYFLAHPMRHVELNENGAELPAFLEVRAEAVRLPPWVSELADLEWWEWKTQNAPDDPGDALAEGALRLASTVELRPYAHDLVPWIRSHAAAGPEKREVVVLFWRDGQLRYRRENATALELGILKVILEGQSPQALTAAGHVTSEHLQATLKDLHDAGVLLGGP